MDLAIRGVSKFFKNYLLSNYSLTTQIIIINLSTTCLALIFIIIFNLFLMTSNKNIESQNKITLNEINNISNYLGINAVKRILSFDESCNSVSEGTNRESARISCDENNLLDNNYQDKSPQLDPTYTQQYIYSNFLNTKLDIKVFGKNMLKIADTNNIYNPKDKVIISDIDNTLMKGNEENINFYRKYKKNYFIIFNKGKEFFDKNKLNINIKNNNIENNNIEKIIENRLPTSFIYLDEEFNFINTFVTPILKDSKVYGLIYINKDIKFDDIESATLSFLLTNFFLFFISIMFSFSFLFSKSIVTPIKKLSFNTNLERDKLSHNKFTIDYLNRKDEIGKLSDDIKSMSIDLKKRVIEIEEFVSDVSHELKNPLTGLKSSSDLLKTNNLNDQNKKLLIKNMGTDIDRMNILISDITNYSLTGLEISEEIFEEVEIIGFLNNFKESLPNKNYLNIKSFLKKINITINKNKFLQVIHNLIDNSLTFVSIKSKILIFIKVQDNECNIQFVDQGPGISMKYKLKIFERFYTDRQDNLKSHSGLGLSISKKIVEGMGGSINLIKSPHKGFDGACFEIKLPLKEF